MLKHFFGGNDDAHVASSPVDSPKTTIDIKHAIDAHMHWRHRLENYARGQSFEQFEIESVIADHRCELGQWIHAVGRVRYGHLPQFQELDTVHADFHRQAGVIVDATQRQQRE